MLLIKKIAQLFKRLPIHPQWLLGQKRVPDGIESINGLVLDIGAADRWIEKHLSNSTHYIALDYPATGHELYGAKPSVFADAANLPFASNIFNGVICLEVIEHVPDPDQVMAEISRVLKSEGYAWISMPFLYPLHDAPFDFQRFTEFGLTRAAQVAGLEIIKFQRAEHAIRTAGLLLCLAIAGGAYTAKGWRKYVLLPFALLIVPVINMSTWLFSLIWPDWQHMTHGHIMQVRKI